MVFYEENGYYYPPQNPYSYSYYPPPPQSSSSYYEYLPTQSLVAYSTPTCNQYEYDASYTNLGSTQYVMYHSVAAPSSPDLNFEEYDPHPYRGGYDIDQTYGKPLPPSDEICYPPSPAAAIARAASIVAAPTPPKEEEEEEDDDDEEAEDLKSEVEEDSVQVFESVGEYNGGRVGNQNPHGCGLETFDLCENLFGYWPCLSRMKNSCDDASGNEIRGSDVDQWTNTAAYLFGNPDPYGEWADEGGYAYHHQMQYSSAPNFNSV